MVTGSLCDQEGGAGSEKEEVLSEFAAPTSSLLVSLDQAMAPPPLWPRPTVAPPPSFPPSTSRVEGLKVGQ